MNVEEMERTLDALGIEYVDSRGSEIQGFCPGHIERVGHADNNPSWYINCDTGAHICFSCQYKGSLYSLIAYVNQFYAEEGGYDFERAKAWLNEGGELLEAFERAISKPKETFEELVYVSEASLAAFVEPPIHALKSRGLTPEAAAHHQVLWDARRENWIIPIRNVYNGSLIGWQEKGFSGRYFKNCPTGVKKSNALFGFDRYTGGDMIVVESPLDVVRLTSIGITGGVSTYGSMISDQQLKNIKFADRIIFALDSDEAGLTSSLKMLKASQDSGFESWFFEYADIDVKDVGGMSKTEVLKGISEARHSVRYATWGAA